MCKILVMPGITDKTRAKAMSFIEKMAVYMSSESDKDGIGYAGLTAKGDLFGERWHNPKEALVKRVDMSTLDSKFSDQFGGFLTPTIEKKYNSFGLGKLGLSNISAITLHSRFATSGKDFENVHPFVTKNLQTSVIHNGVISNHLSLKKEMSTCDSEVILHAYNEAKVYDDLTSIHELVKSLYGNYACGVFSMSSKGERILDIFKETRSTLHAVYISELETYAFVTKLEYAQSACVDLGLTITQEYKIKDDMIIRVNPFTGKCMGYTSFKSNSYSDYTSTGHAYGTNYTRDEEDYNTYAKKDGPGTSQSTSGNSQNKPDSDSLRTGGSVIALKDGDYLQKGGPSSKGFPSSKEVRDLNKATEDEEAARKFIYGLSDDGLIASCNTFLVNYLAREPDEWVDANILVARLRAVKKDNKVDKIIDALCGEYGWEEYCYETTKEWYFMRREAKRC